jgi:hypothetical protein
MNSVANFVRRMFAYAAGDVPPGVIAQQDLTNLIHQIKVNGYGLADKYSAKIYNIVEIGIPNDKHAILRRGIEDIMKTLVESINLHVIMELDKINDKINEPVKTIPRG